jgi:hypothetical protein
VTGQAPLPVCPHPRRVKSLLSAGNLYKVLGFSPYAYYAKYIYSFPIFPPPLFNGISCQFLNFDHGYDNTIFAQITRVEDLRVLWHSFYQLRKL